MKTKSKLSISLLSLFAFACGGDDSQSLQLVNVGDEPAGANCTAGGTFVKSGIDANDDGVLDADEVANTSFICNATDELVSIDDEPAGANCAFGGTALNTGTDDNGDGVLDADEVDDTTYICDPDPAGPSLSLVSLADEPPGVNCPLGGTALNTGVDTNNDGVLDGDEVTATEFVCQGAAVNTVIDGNVVIRTALEAALFASFTEVTGDLIFDRVDFLADQSELAFPSLTTVGGSLLVDNLNISALALPLLTSVGESLVLSNNDLLESVDLSSLATVGDDLSVRFNPALTALGAPALSTVGVDLIFQGNALATLDLPVTTVGGLLIVIDETLLTSVAMPQLTAIGRDLVLFSLPALTNADFSGLTSLAVNIRITDTGDSASPAAVNLSALVTLGISLQINIGSAVASLDASALTSVGSSVDIRTPDLTTLTIPVLETVGQTFTIESATDFTTLDAPALVSVGSLILNNTSLLDTLNLPVLDEITSTFRATNNAALACTDADAVFNALSVQPATVQISNNLAACTGLL